MPQVVLELGNTNPDTILKAVNLVHSIQRTESDSGATRTMAVVRSKSLMQAVEGSSSTLGRSSSDGSLSRSSSSGSNCTVPSMISDSSSDTTVTDLPAGQPLARITPADMCVSDETLAAIAKAQLTPDAGVGLSWKDARTYTHVHTCKIVSADIYRFLYIYIYACSTRAKATKASKGRRAPGSRWGLQNRHPGHNEESLSPLPRAKR